MEKKWRRNGRLHGEEKLHISLPIFLVLEQVISMD